MLVPGNIGFSCLVLVLLSLPVVGFFVVRRKWRLALARGEEVRRLLLLASEEAARVELEASSVCYGAVSGADAGAPARSYNPHPHCAVCFFPTTTRCARCKAVRYCSGKCQVIHWRQGHKEQCHPPSTNYQNNHKGSNFSLKAGKQNCSNIHKAEGKGGVKPYEVPAKEPALTNSTCSSEPLYRGDDKLKVKPLDNVLETNLISKSFHASGSDGFVSFAPSTESFYDASDMEISSSNHLERSDGHQYVDVSGDFPDTPSSIKKKHQTQPVIPEHTKLAGSAGGFTSSTVSRVDNTQSGSTVCTDPDFSGSGDGSFVEFSTASSGSRKSTSNKEDQGTDDGRSSLHVASGGNITSESGAFKRFSFNLSGYAIPALLDNSECKPDAASLERKKSINGVASSENNMKGVSDVKNSQSLSSERYRHMVRHPLSDSRLINTSNFCDKRPKDVHGNIPHLSKSREAGTSTSNTPQSSDSGRNSVSGDKRGKVDGIHASAAILRYPQNVSNGLKTSAVKVIGQIRPSVLSKQYPVGVRSEVSKRYGGKGLFPFDVFVKLFNWKEELQPCGLTNCGNSCFANVVLQCLAFTPTLTAYLLQRLHSKSCRKLEWCFSCEFERLILKMKEGKSPLSPIGILSRIGRISGHLTNGKEEDAHEFLRYVIDTMQSICIKDAGVNESRAFGEETTLIGLTFGGYLRSKIKCMKCRGKSEQHERMMDLTVEIEGDIGSLEEALRKFTSTEILDGQNKYKCGRCKSYEKAKKKFTVLEAPNVLTIALKRFQSGKFGKLNKLIRFPEILDLAPYMSRASDKSPVYSLYGVVVHLDIMNAAFSGHYVCYVKSIQNKWFKIDDSTVKAVDREAVLTKGAYMLLYSRCSPREPKSIRNTVVSDDARLKSPLGMKNSPSKSPLHSGRLSSDGPLNADWVRRSIDVDVYSDSSSLFSGSDEGSCSTESSRDSTSTMDLSDYIFSDLGYGWNSPHRGSSDSDTSSPSSVLYSRRSSLADLDRYAECDGLGGISKRNSKEGGMGPHRHLYSDTTIKQLRNVGSNSSNNRGTNSGVPFRR